VILSYSEKIFVTKISFSLIALCNWGKIKIVSVNILIYQIRTFKTISVSQERPFSISGHINLDIISYNEISLSLGLSKKNRLSQI